MTRRAGGATSVARRRRLPDMISFIASSIALVRLSKNGPKLSLRWGITSPWFHGAAPSSAV